MQSVILGLGSNAAFCREGISMRPEDILYEACLILQSVFEKGSFIVSSVYKTKPLYYTDQADFYNMAVSGLYSGTAESLFSAAQAIEAVLGRDRKNEVRNGPRTIDIDIELFGTQIIKNEFLTIPHEKITEREFVLIPLLEISPECADPISGVKYNTMVSALPGQGVIKILPPFDLG